VPDELRDSACGRVIRAVTNTLQDKVGRWIAGMDDNIHEASTELALSGMISGTVINCVMDRSFVDVHGIRWIIDFKTSTHEGGDREAFLNSEVQRYQHQLQRYATLMRAWKPAQPVKIALYFPLLSEWRELK
jgi:ATP-dependent helicase/nuclease subunit A